MKKGSKFETERETRVITIDLLADYLGTYRKALYQDIIRFEDQTKKQFSTHNCLAVVDFVRWYDKKVVINLD
jgi:hypothetical protein